MTTLLIPGLNDSQPELERMTAWFAENLGASVPLHFTAFHPDYRLRDRPATPPSTLLAARDIARQAGLRFVYTGNVVSPETQSTRCPNCEQLLVGRDGALAGQYRGRYSEALAAEVADGIAALGGAT